MKRLWLVIGALWLAAFVALPVQARDTVYYYYTNTLHSAVVETNAQGAVVEQTHYAPNKGARFIYSRRNKACTAGFVRFGDGDPYVGRPAIRPAAARAAMG